MGRNWAPQESQSLVARMVAGHSGLVLQQHLTSIYAAGLTKTQRKEAVWLALRMDMPHLGAQGARSDSGSELSSEEQRKPRVPTHSAG